MPFLHFLYFSLCPLKDWRKFVIRIECTDQLCVMPATVHLRVSVMTQRQTVRSTYSYCIAGYHSLANLVFIHPSIHLFTSWFHPSTCPLLSPPSSLFSANTTPPPAALLIEVSALRDLTVNSWSVVVNYEWLFQVRARGSGPERTPGGKAGINYCPACAFSGREGRLATENKYAH